MVAHRMVPTLCSLARIVLIAYQVAAALGTCPALDAGFLSHLSSLPLRHFRV